MEHKNVKRVMPKGLQGIGGIKVMKMLHERKGKGINYALLVASMVVPNKEAAMTLCSRLASLCWIERRGNYWYLTSRGTALMITPKPRTSPFPTLRKCGLPAAQHKLLEAVIGSGKQGLPLGKAIHSGFFESKAQAQHACAQLQQHGWIRSSFDVLRGTELANRAIKGAEQ